MRGRSLVLYSFRHAKSKNTYPPSVCLPHSPIPYHISLVLPSPALYGSGDGKAPSKRGASARGRASKARSARASGEAGEAEEMLADLKKKAGVKAGEEEEGER